MPCTAFHSALLVVVTAFIFILSLSNWFEMLYSTRGVMYAYTLPSSDPTCRIALGIFLLLLLQRDVFIYLLDELISF